MESKTSKKNVYSILLVVGIFLWSAAVLLRGTSVMDIAILKRLIWVAPNIGVVWAGVGFAYLLFPRIFKREFNPKHTAVLLGSILAALLLSETMHHFWLGSAFDIWDMAASAVAAAIVLALRTL